MNSKTSPDAPPRPSELSERDSPRYIVIEGPIGVGKTALAQRLALSLHCEKLFELDEPNPFLERFYANEHNSALPTQLFFLFQRVNQISQLQQRDMFAPTHVSDFLIQKDRLFAQVTLDNEAFKLYEKIYQHLDFEPPKPDLVVYLQAPVDVLLERIRARGSSSEQTIDADYLNRLTDAYANFFHFYDEAPLLIVNATDIDWANNESDYQHLLERMFQVKTGRHYYNPHPSIL